MAEPSVGSAYENARLIHKVLSLYYDTDATQSDIARQLGISTPKVNRLLQQARRQGMVRISLHTPFQQLFDLEKRLEETFLIPEVVVLPSSTGDTQALLSALGTVAARYLLEHLQDGDVIAIGGGTTVQAIVEAVNPQRAYRVDVVPVVGGVQGRVTTDVNFLAAQLAERLGGQAFQLHSPVFAESSQQRQALMNMRPIKDILNIARQATIALLGIGTVDPEDLPFCSIYRPVRRRDESDCRPIPRHRRNIGDHLRPDWKTLRSTLCRSGGWPDDRRVAGCSVADWRGRFT